MTRLDPDQQLVARWERRLEGGVSINIDEVRPARLAREFPEHDVRELSSEAARVMCHDGATRLEFDHFEAAAERLEAEEVSEA